MDGKVLGMKANDDSATTILDELKQTLPVSEVKELIAQRTDEIKLFLQGVRLDSLPWKEKSRVTYLAETFGAYWLERVSAYSRISDTADKSLAELYEARDILDECLRNLQAVDWSPRITARDIRRVKYTKLTLDALIAQRERRDPRTTSVLWRRAADELRRDRFGKLRGVSQTVVRLRENCLSKANTLEGFGYLRLEAADLPSSIRKLATALYHAKKAVDHGESEDNAKYISYWVLVLKSENALISRDFDPAHKHLEESSECITPLVQRGRKVFPNRYKNIEDLKNCHSLVSACQALSQRNLPECRGYLDQWHNQAARLGLEGFWRTENVKVRQIAVQALIEHVNNRNLVAFRSCLGRLHDELDTKPQLGGASRAMYQILTDFGKGSLSEEEVVESLYRVFPLGAYPSNELQNPFWQPSKGSRLARLPRFYQEWTLPRGSDSNVIAFSRMEYVLFSFLRAICEYWLGIQKETPLKAPFSSSESNWDALQKQARDLIDFLPCEAQTELEELLREMQSWLSRAQGLELHITRLAMEAQDILANRSHRLFPHPIRVKARRPGGNGWCTYLVERQWNRDPLQLTLTLNPFHSALKVGGFYLLEPRWKIDDKISFSTKPNEQILIVESTTFSEPLSTPVVLLVEGDTECRAMPILLDEVCPWWEALISIENGGGDRTPQVYQSLKTQNRVVKTIYDKDRQDPSAASHWHPITQDTANSLPVDPDFEGFKPSCLCRALNQLYPELGITENQVRQAVDLRRRWEARQVRKKGGTLGALDRIIQTWKKGQLSLTDHKPEIGEMLAKIMIEEEIPQELLTFLGRVLDSGEGKNQQAL